MRISQNGKVSELLRDVPIPRMFHARQEFDGSHIDPQDIPAVDGPSELDFDEEGNLTGVL
ncbi:MAG: hypothetical protein IJK56_06535 [Firmicutes bacterium]|nr:hypothetical protein [Bacillota bacterium]